MKEPKRIKSDFYDALVKHYEAEIEKNLATLSLYLTKPTAIADHSNLLEDMKALTTKLAEANDGWSALKTYFEKDDQNEV